MISNSRVRTAAHVLKYVERFRSQALVVPFSNPCSGFGAIYNHSDEPNIYACRYCDTPLLQARLDWKNAFPAHPHNDAGHCRGL